jgi:hypothetical protein
MIDAAKLKTVGEEVKVALRALHRQGHTPSCACKLCYAAKYLSSAHSHLKALWEITKKGNGSCDGDG